MANAPFSLAYVLKATAKHMRRSIDISLRKTTNRWEEFKDDEVKSKEVMKTIMKLTELRALLDDYQKLNIEDFRESNNDHQS